MKIKYKIIEKLNTLTAKEMELFFYIVQHMNQAAGSTAGVHYRDVTKQTGMCKQSFYNALRGLEEKGVVAISRSSEIDYDIWILGNDFPNQGSYTEGYVNLNRMAFRSRNFKRLKAHEKYLLLEFMKGTHENGHSLQIGVDRLYQKFMEILGVTKRVLRGYLHSLKKFFSIGVKDGKYYITYLHSVFHDRYHGKAEENWYLEHEARKECRRRHTSYTESDIEEMVRIVKQYRQLCGGTEDMLHILKECIRYSVEGVRWKDRMLKKKYIHMLVRKAIFDPGTA